MNDLFAARSQMAMSLAFHIIFAVVGIAEEFDRSLILIKRILGWRNPFYTKQNVSRGRALKEDLAPETLRVIEAYNALDIELYRYAKQLFEENIRSQGPSFEKELQAFRMLNDTYRWLNVLLSAARRGVETASPVVRSLFVRHE